jgi:hypothetical protein
MFPSTLPSVMQQMNAAERERGLEVARHRQALAATRRERSRNWFVKARSRKVGLRTESQVNVRPA